MARPTDSFKQFDYSLRPSKQVERKIMIEVLLSLSKAGFNIDEYTYLGLGSPYYVDFVMFHKYLSIQDMVCVEWADIEKRMKFNKPFGFIKLRMQALAEHIPSIQRRKKYLVWLDYDRSLDLEMLQDIDGCLNRMVRKSIFVITVDARPRLPQDPIEFEKMTEEEREMETLRTYQEWFGHYVEEGITRDTVSRSHVVPLFYEVVVERIQQTLTTRGSGLHFIQIFNYMYSDGAPMFTIGGMIGTEEDQKGLQKAGILTRRYVRTNSESLKISLPLLTVREKHWLDRNLYKSADKLHFELEEELLENYYKFYKEYPTYMETLL